MFFENSLNQPVTRSLRTEEASSFRGFSPQPLSTDTKEFPSKAFTSNTNEKSEITKGLLGLNLNQKNVLVPPCPCYYEASSSFFSDKLPLVLIQYILLLLQHHQIDFSFASEKFKLQCVWYTEANVSCVFVIRIFKSLQQKAQHLVEFQRRNGCVIAFRRLFHQLLRTFSHDGVALDSVAADVPLPCSEINLDKKTATLMLQTLSSQDVSLEYIRETLRVLSCLSKQPCNLAMLLQVNGKLPELLLQFLKSKDVEILRCAALFLANLVSVHSNNTVLHKHVSFFFDAYTATDLESPGYGSTARNLIHLEIKRQLTRSILALTAKNSDAIAKQPLFSNYVKVLKEATLSPDSKLQNFANQTLIHFAS